MSKTKHNPPNQKAKDEPRFIRFSKLQQNYLLEVRSRNIREWGEALQSVYEELNMLEEVLAAPKAYRARLDLSGMDFMPVPPPPSPIDEEEEKKKAEALRLAEKKKAEEELKSKETH